MSVAPGDRRKLRSPRSEHGVTGVEYALLIAFIAAAIAGAAVALGTETSGLFGLVSEEYRSVTPPTADTDCPLPEQTNPRAHQRVESGG